MTTASAPYTRTTASPKKTVVETSSLMIQPAAAQRTAEFLTYAPSPLQRFCVAIGGRLPHGWLGKRVSGWLRALLQATSGAPVDMEVLGVRMRLNLKDNSCERRLMVTPQFFDPDELAALKSRLHRGFSFVDVGANVGAYSLFVARHCAHAHVLAVEPHPAILSRLKENIALNGFDIPVEAAAVSDFLGTMTLYTDSNNLGATTMQTDNPVRGERGKIEAPVRPLFDIVKKHGFDHIDAMKLDVEGGEARALMPFLEQAPEGLWPSMLIAENNEAKWECDLIGELQQRGWKFERETRGSNFIMVRD